MRVATPYLDLETSENWEDHTKESRSCNAFNAFLTSFSAAMLALRGSINTDSKRLTSTPMQMPPVRRIATMRAAAQQKQKHYLKLLMTGRSLSA